MSNLGQAKPASEAVEGTASDQAQLNERKFNAAFAESVCNDTVINWRYWVEQMPRISAAEAARLMCALDPDLFKSLDHRPNNNGPSDLCRKAEMIQRLAERQGKLTASPADWLAWAREQKIKVHDGFRIEVESLPASATQGSPAQNTATPAPDDKKPWLVVDPTDPIAPHHWYTPARYFARQLVLSDSTLLIKKLVLADKVSRSLASAGIYKRGGKKPHDAATVLKAFANVTLG